MPVIELDMLIGLVNPHDRLHSLAEKLFKEVSAGKIKITVASSALLEYELLLRSRGYSEKEIRLDIEAFKNMLSEIPINSDVMVKASELREKFGLTYFDSLHAASAINVDGVIVSTDREYEGIEDLDAIKPDEFLKNFNLNKQ